MQGHIHGRQHQKTREYRDADIDCRYQAPDQRQVLGVIQVGAVDEHGAHTQRQGEKRRTQGVEDQIRGQGAMEVRQQVDLQALAGTVQRQYVGYQRHQGDQQHWHQSRGPFLNAVLHPLGDDGDGQPHKHQRAQFIAHKTEGGEPAGYLIPTEHGSERGQAECHHPAGDNGIKTQDQAGDNKAQCTGGPADTPLQAIIGQFAERSHSVGVGVTANYQLGHQRRVSQGECQHKVDQQERGAAVTGGLGGKSPDVAKPHGASRRRHHEAETRAEFTPC